MKSLDQTYLLGKAAHLALSAVDIIYEKGLDQVKLTGVAKQASVITGTVTYYFEDKSGKIIAAIKWHWNMRNPRSTAMVRRVPS